MPHQEVNLDAEAPLDFVVMRSDNERIAVALDISPDGEPTRAADQGRARA